jgi:hypothetical protein
MSLTLIVGIAVLLLIAFVPLWIGTNVAGAGRQGPGPAFVALIVAAMVIVLMVMFVHHGLLLSVFATALVYMLVVETTYFKGLAISTIQLVTTWLVVIFFAARYVGPRVSHIFHV